MKNIVYATMLAVTLAYSTSSLAMIVDVNFSGAGSLNSLGEWEVKLGDVFTATVIASLTPEEDAAGGLLSFSSAVSLSPSGPVTVKLGQIVNADWPAGNEVSADMFSASAWGGTLGALAPTGTATLFSLTLEASGNYGVTTLTMFDFEKSSTWDGNVLADGSVIDGLIVYNDSNISVVPIPMAAWLFGSAVIGTFGFLRRHCA